MPSEEAQDQRPTVTSAQSYDAAQTALGMTRPDDLAMLKESLRQNMAEVDLKPAELAAFINLLEYISQRPAEYSQIRQKLIDDDLVDPEDMPEEYDVEFIGTMLAVLNEVQMSQAQGAQAPMMDMPPVEGADAMQGMGPMQPMAMAEGGLADVASYLAAQGRHGDTMLAHITPEEAQLLRDRGGSGTINPVTGLPEFFKFLKKIWKGVTSVARKVLKSPIGRILATVALAMVLGPGAAGFSGFGLSAGTAAGLASGAVTLAGGGSIKDALVSGAMGYIGGGGTVMGANPLASVGQYLPGAAGSALNTGLTTGAIGAGIGKLSGMSTQDALRMGLTSGASAAALTGLQNTSQAALGGGTAQDLLNAQAASGDGTGLQLPPGAAPEPGYTVAGNTVPPAGAPVQAPVDASSALQLPPGAAPEPGYTVAGAKPGFFDEMTTGAKNLYSEYLSPSRPGMAADAGMFTKYAPLAAAGTAAIGLAGGMKSEPVNQNPAFNRAYTGSDYMRDNPAQFAGGLSTYTRPDIPANPIVPTPSYASIPVGPPGMITPSGITQQPSGIAQPYNMAGMYGVPLIYGPDGQPQRMAKGGDAKPTNFPRKNGPVNGPGTGTSDEIPAMLSDGEFVFTAKAVRNAGSGSRRKGAARMYKLMKMLEGGPVKGK
jgi:hypothetical protein